MTTYPNYNIPQRAWGPWLLVSVFLNVFNKYLFVIMFMHNSKHFAYVASFASDMDRTSIIIPTLQMKKLRHREKLRDAPSGNDGAGIWIPAVWLKIMGSTTKFWSFLWPEIYKGLTNINLAIYSYGIWVLRWCAMCLSTPFPFPPGHTDHISQPYSWFSAVKLTTDQWNVSESEQSPQHPWPQHPCTTSHFSSLTCSQMHKSPRFLNRCTKQSPLLPRLHSTKTSKTRAFVAVSCEDFEADCYSSITWHLQWSRHIKIKGNNFTKD